MLKNGHCFFDDTLGNTLKLWSRNIWFYYLMHWRCIGILWFLSLIYLIPILNPLLLINIVIFKGITCYILKVLAGFFQEKSQLSQFLLEHMTVVLYSKTSQWLKFLSLKKTMSMLCSMGKMHLVGFVHILHPSLWNKQ